MKGPVADGPAGAGATCFAATRLEKYRRINHVEGPKPTNNTMTVTIGAPVVRRARGGIELHLHEEKEGKKEDDGPDDLALAQQRSPRHELQWHESHDGNASSYSQVTRPAHAFDVAARPTSP